MTLQIDHISLSVANLNNAEKFYDAIMPILGAKKVEGSAEALKYGIRNTPDAHHNSYLTIFEAQDFTRNHANHWCFQVDKRDRVDSFHVQGIANGGYDAGQPGLRAEYHEGYYAAFLIDPSGNKIEVVCHSL